MNGVETNLMTGLNRVLTDVSQKHFQTTVLKIMSVRNAGIISKKFKPQSANTILLY